MSRRPRPSNHAPGTGRTSGRQANGSRTSRDRRRRDLSQNFVIDRRAIDRVLEAADPRPSDRVVDLGAGTGALTLPLAETAGSVLAVELDPQWVERLRNIAASFPNIEVVYGDLRDVPLPSSPFRVVASPPYHLSTDLVRRLLTLDLPLRDATLVLERNTAQRLAGATRASRLSLRWAPWFDLRMGARIDRRSFRPVPGSDSSILHLQPRRVPTISPARFEAWTAFIDVLFEANGRTVADRWARVHSRRSAEVLADVSGIDLRQTPGAMAVEDWLAVFRANDRPIPAPR